MILLLIILCIIGVIGTVDVPTLQVYGYKPIDNAVLIKALKGARLNSLDNDIIVIPRGKTINFAAKFPFFSFLGKYYIDYEGERYPVYRFSPQEKLLDSMFIQLKNIPIHEDKNKEST